MKIHLETLLESLTRAKLCIGDAKRPVEVYKCFKFSEGTVSAHNGYQGIITRCPLDLECVVYADKLYSYLKALDTEEVDVSLDQNLLRVGGAKFPTLLNEDFPDIVRDDLDTVGEADLHLGAKAVRFCAGSTRVGIPPSIRFVGGFAYGSDSKRAARFELEGELAEALCLPLDACKTLERMGKATQLVAGAGAFGAFYEESGTFFVAQQIEAPDFTKVVDGQLDEPAGNHFKLPLMGPALKRLAVIEPEGQVVLRYEAKEQALKLEVVNRESGAFAVEEVDWPSDTWTVAPSKSFRIKVAIPILAEALGQPDVLMVGLGDVLRGRQSVVRLYGRRLSQLLALTVD